MFQDNKYSKWYFSIIDKAKIENRKKSTDVYLESHHIIPKSLGGKKQVLLTAKEHYVAHCCLVKAIIPKHKKRMVAALSKMQSSNKYQTGRCSLNYTMARKLCRGENNWMYGKTHTAEARGKISNAAKGHTRRLGIKHTAEAREKISNAAKGNKRRIGKTHTEQTKAIISAKAKLRVPLYNSTLTAAERSEKYGSAKGKTWYYDPISLLRFYGQAGTQPDGYVKGFKRING
jgi:hypothetical protein